jgi:hypothetical protein
MLGNFLQVFFLAITPRIGVARCKMTSLCASVEVTEQADVADINLSLTPDETIKVSHGLSTG